MSQAHVFPVEGDGTLNQFFQDLPLDEFPKPSMGKVLELPSDMSIATACRTLSERNFLAAPVRDVSVPDDASWVDKYVGIIDFLSIVDWMVRAMGGAVPKSLSELLALKDGFAETTIGELTSKSRWSRFVPLDSKRSSFLDAILLLGKYGQHRVCIVESPGGGLVNMLTQSALLDEMTRSNPAFSSVTSKSLKELGWSEKHSTQSVLTVNIHATYWEAFNVMSRNLISAVPIVSDKGVMIGNLSVKDLRNMINDPARFPSLSVPMSEFPSFPLHLLTCREKDTLQDVMEKLSHTKVHRLFLVDDNTRPVGVVSLGDILAKFVHEPKDSDLSEYFADQVALASAEKKD